MIHDLMLYLDNVDDISVLKAGAVVIVLLMFTQLLLEEKPNADR